MLTQTRHNLSQTESFAKYCLYISLANMLIAAASTIPMLVPELGLPLVIQQWPGTWMFIAYFTLLITGVLGYIAWAVIYYLSPRLLGKERVNPYLAITHIVLFEVSMLVAVTLMGAVAGFQGGTLLHIGFGQFIVTRVIEWVVIPIGIMISLALIATVIGIMNLVISPSRKE